MKKPAKPTKTVAEALAEIAKTIEDHAIAGTKALRVSSFPDSLTAQWERGWGIDATIDVNVRREDTGGDLPSRFLVVGVNWSTGSSSPVRAIAASELHGQVARLACLLESQWANVDLAPSSK